jgi:predicted nucleic acid-binding protein
MTVVTDSSPLHYLIVIGAVDVLPSLYGSVLVPQSVARELHHSRAPEPVRAWIPQPPSWCEVRKDAPFDPTLEWLGKGERAAISLALSVHAERLLIDEWEGRLEAERRRLRVTGTLGILAEAHSANLLNFDEAVYRLRDTNFYMPAEILNILRQHLSSRAK